MADHRIRWQHLVSAPLPGAANMAWDDALMARARRTGHAVLRVYAWQSPTLSLGRNQAARDAYDTDAAARLGVEFVRRPTGGRALLHWHEVTYSVTAPDAFDATLRGAYDRINALLLHALRELGVPAHLAAPAKRTIAPGLAPCFDQPSAGEIVANGAKLVGSAQWRADGALLQHGSILVEDDQPLIGQVLRRPQPAPPPAATLARLVTPTPAFHDVAAKLVDALRVLSPDTAPLEPDAELERDVRAATARYADPEWTWRR
ncbi:MAG TPA: hypothetical protein VG818_05650 [Gemmatimonadaceae bacterium]|nr:hypothetical protein [Gemmatimonadaceae bacterium]